MRKMSILLIILCVKSVMAQEPVPKGQPLLIGSYQTTAYVDSSNKPFDEVWSKIIDVVAENGISISTIDKSSGIIISNSHSFITNFTLEKDGSPKDPSAWIVVRDEGWGNISSLTGNFNIRVKTENRRTIISVKLNNIKASKYAGGMRMSFPAQSLGVFERILVEQVK